MNEIKMTTQDMKEEINKDMETLKNNQTKIFKIQYPKEILQSKAW
jgi:hypothetical protein